MSVRTQPTKPGWRHLRELAGVGLTGQRVDILTGVVETPAGLAPALLVGVCGLVVDELLVEGLVTALQQATEDARNGGEPLW
ncbi:hypothetical protein [Amycolatopsis keratiniphila]|uniref:Uncharacterized protein n=1 Tax=Amycolatopsis keratiniphila subsp. keratiniphila TaxID=227715 RepID=A0A1W2LHG8_9PSEU|nr:hypothetical protein [Amycolatopsis keratiniphila]ONF62309.1 hypothetical protein AVR91_0238765 [Amycolatopsis keratiniphila subsp. keratiniphila]